MNVDDQDADMPAIDFFNTSTKTQHVSSKKSIKPHLSQVRAGMPPGLLIEKAGLPKFSKTKAARFFCWLTILRKEVLG